MAIALRLTKPERTILAELLTVKLEEGGKPGPLKLYASIADKLEASELLSSKKSSGAAFPVKDAIEAFRSVLGDRLVVPPNPGKLFYILMSKGLGFLGADAETCKEIAQQAAVEWSGRIRAESLVRQGAVLLTSAAEAKAKGTNSTPMTSASGTTSPGAWDDLADL